MLNRVTLAPFSVISRGMTTSEVMTLLRMLLMETLGKIEVVTRGNLQTRSRSRW
jgi:hypothetical protein